jgi:hypothetical protein
MNFSQMLIQLDKRGVRCRRTGWNGKGMYLFIVTDWDITKATALIEVVSEDVAAELAPFVCMRTADQKLVPWLASQTDILATDWEIL